MTMMLCSFMILTVPSIIAAQPAFSRGERQRGLGARSVISGGDTLYPAVAGGDTPGLPGIYMRAATEYECFALFRGRIFIEFKAIYLYL
ncbi:hypothetical protein [Selenomonas artemidis]|uniref:hypothetical protein n=1 Tax=Selenomonas artemidis TaxID=671224 RepID=UPI0028E9992B|nr:hypothetical protein [Selenomonas artemidis]